MMPEHIRLTAPAVILSPPGVYAAQVGLPRQVGEVLSVRANVTDEQARDLLASGDAVNAYGDPPRWD